MTEWELRGDLWHWCAVMKDSSVLHEYDDAGNARGFASIDQSRLAQFHLIPQVPDLPQHALEIHADERPIFFRRRTRNYDTNTGDLLGESTVHVLGWQDTVNGVNVKSFCFLLPNGCVLVSRNPDAV